MASTYKTQVINGKFIISELVVDHWASTTRQGAWDRARAQANPVIFIAQDGTERELGDCFNTEVFERAMYGGHVSYQLSMTDGHYAPEPAEVWIARFRRFPGTTYNDAPAEVVAALPRYTELAAA